MSGNRTETLISSSNTEGLRELQYGKTLRNPGAVTRHTVPVSEMGKELHFVNILVGSYDVTEKN